MKKKLKDLRSKALVKFLGIEPALLQSEVAITRQELAEIKSMIQAGLSGLESQETHRAQSQAERLALMEGQLRDLLTIGRKQLDEIDLRTEQLRQLRASAEYKTMLSDRNPLVSIRIATYTRTAELMERALPSILRQTYKNIEVVVVNDGPNEATRNAIGSLNDPRVRYFETAERGNYPDNPQHRWMVAGTDPINLATQLAKGTWIGHLDDDDELAPDHVEKLLEVAWESNAELAYGALTQENLVTGETHTIWSDPPAMNNFSFQGALYLTALKFFRYDDVAWLYQEPGDWNLMRRMKSAGVRMAATRDVVGHLYMVPYTHK